MKTFFRVGPLLNGFISTMQLQVKNNSLIQELIKANDHIAFLSRLTNNKIKVFGQEFTNQDDKGYPRSQDDMYVDQNSVYGSKDLMNATYGSKFHYQTMNPSGEAEDDNQTNMRSPVRRNGDGQAQNEENEFLDQLSKDFKKASDEEKKLPEVLY